MKKILFVLWVLITTFSSCKKEKDSEKVYKITYNIGCTDCEVIYVSDTEGTQSAEFHRNSTWSYTFNAKQNQEVLLLAYNTATAPQGVTATILLNDSVLTSRTTYCPINGISFCADTVR